MLERALGDLARRGPFLAHEEPLLGQESRRDLPPPRPRMASRDNEDQLVVETRGQALFAGILAGSVATALLPHVSGQATLLALVTVFGAVSGVAFVAISVALAAATTPATRGLVMGGYSTSLYLGLALGSFALGPVITHHGYAVGFAAAGASGGIGTLGAALLWARGGTTPPGDA